MTTTPRAHIIAQAREWLGTPFHHQARVKGVGADCAGLVIGVARALDIVGPDFDVAAYPRTPDGTTLIRLLDQHMTRIALAAMQGGDVVETGDCASVFTNPQSDYTKALMAAAFGA